MDPISLALPLLSAVTEAGVRSFADQNGTAVGEEEPTATEA